MPQFKPGQPKPPGSGRKPGTANRATTIEQELFERLGGRCTAAWEWILERTPGELASELQCSLLDAARLRLLAARDASPFLYRRKPTAVELAADPAVFEPVDVGTLTADQARAILFKRLGPLAPPSSVT